MAEVKVPKSIRPKKRVSPLVAHRKCSQFKDFVKLLHESHARVSERQEPAPEERKLEAVH